MGNRDALSDESLMGDTMTFAWQARVDEPASADSCIEPEMVVGERTIRNFDLFTPEDSAAAAPMSSLVIAERGSAALAQHDLPLRDARIDRSSK